MPTSPFVVAYVVGGFTFIPTILLLIYLIQRHHFPTNQQVLRYPRLYDTSASHHPSHSCKSGWLRVSHHPQTLPPQAANVGEFVKNMFKPELYYDMYFVVLKQTTLFFYDSERQLDCKGVIQMRACKVRMHPPGLKDHELFNRAQVIKIVNVLNGSAHYLNCRRPTDKEDWYHALLRVSAATSGAGAAVATAGVIATVATASAAEGESSLDQTAINHLITTIHSNPSHFETQWFNALIGRLFCGVLHTDRIRTLLYNKLVSKLAKINRCRPQFLGPITVRSVDPGFAQPYLTEPRLLHLTQKGELVAEARIDYSGHLKFEIESVFQWQYAEQFKPFQVRIVLAITLQSLKGRIRLNIKAPPSNRIWYGFYSLPEMDWLVEPIVWERRVGYSMVVNAIKAKMEEAVMKNAVLPNQDDITFFPTRDAQGGIFI